LERQKVVKNTKKPGFTRPGSLPVGRKRQLPRPKPRNDQEQPPPRKSDRERRKIHFDGAHFRRDLAAKAVE
jgi:hypothetical protein